MKRARPRGFTLIELMISVAIVGVLSSVAIPTLTRASLRAKKAERDAIMDAVNRGAQAVLVREGRFPDPFLGPWNPATPPGTSRLPLDLTLGNWRMLDVGVEGAVYHQYRFVGLTADATSPTTLDVFAQGDLDGDGVTQRRTVMYVVRDGALLLREDDQFDPEGDVAF